jgi:DNA-binding NarL/FixJ family response regulator
MFDLALAKTVDKTGGMAGLLGKSALPKIGVDLFIVDWETPTGGLPAFIKTIKAKYSGNYRFLVVADKRYAAEMAQAMKAGATDCLIKPFTSSEFKEKMDNVLSAKPLTVQSYSLSKTKEEKKPAVVTSSVSSPAWGAKPAASPSAPPSAATQVTPKFSSAPPSGTTQITPKFPPPQASGGAKGGGPSFYTSTKKKPGKGDLPTATLIDGAINGHYHEKVDVIGGGENCYWAREAEGDKVRLEYLSAKGTATGVEAKVIDKEEFMFNYYLCEEYGCHILKRMGKWPPPEAQ